MAASGESLDFKDFLTTEDIPLERFHEVRREVHCRVDQRSGLEALVADFDTLLRNFSSDNKAEVRKGVARWLLGQIDEAVPILEPARASREKAYFLGLSYLEAGNAKAALPHLKDAYDADSSDKLVSSAFCEAKIRLYLFSSDYPHMEGGRDPLGRFERSLEGEDDATWSKFFSQNFERVFGASPA